MRKIIATAAVATLAFAGLTALSGQASAAPNDVTATYGCNSATFTNNTSETINVNYGTANSGDVTDVQIPAGKSATVMAKTKNFGWTATSPNGTELAMLEWPGVDLPGNCTEAAREEQAKLFTVTYSCNQATFTNNTGGQVVLQYGQQNSGDTNTETLGNGQVFVAKSTANNFGWLAQERDGRTINV
ncbi:MAG: hypothetical protein Q4G46_15380, partial [Propionibacteriaceae bacterium]|nr:hypothetical protein [Propionibacteriaceae bacterium]